MPAIQRGSTRKQVGEAIKMLESFVADLKKNRRKIRDLSIEWSRPEIEIPSRIRHFREFAAGPDIYLKAHIEMRG